MKKTWRWFGPKDPITLSMLKQIGVEGIVTALHDIPNGEVWTLDAIQHRYNIIKDAGLEWSVVESLPVSEAIKCGAPERDRLIENYIQSLENLARVGVKTVCYNFMPVIDWIRTDLEHPLDDGTKTLYYDRIKFAYFDCHILQREGAAADYSPEGLAQVEELSKVITPDEEAKLIDTIIVKTQGFINGNISEGDKNPVELFKSLLKRYEGIDRGQLRENLVYWLKAILPTCSKYGIQMCIHPDDPPFQVLGLPRIVTNAHDVAWILNAVDHPSNGFTFCAGSLSASKENDVPQMARLFASRSPFLHLRYTTTVGEGDFMESSHLNPELIEVMRIFEQQNPAVAMRPDHGRDMLGDEDKGYNPGYSFHGRMLALGQLSGMLAVIQEELK